LHATTSKQQTKTERWSFTKKAMTLKEKVTLVAQHNRLYLFKEGVFYKAYNQNAMWFAQKIKRYNVTVKYIKKIQQEVFSIGFPISYLDSIHLK
jgi:hypothetical protein